MKLKTFASIAILAITTYACDDNSKDKNVEETVVEQSKVIDTTASGLGVEFLRKGNGKPFEMGNKAIFFYRIKLPQHKNRVVDNNFGKTPLEMIIGKGIMPAGVEEGMGLMNVGDVVRLYIPAKIGYQEVKPDIPLGSDIVYEIELLGQKSILPDFDTTGIQKARTPMGVEYWLIQENPEGDFVLPGNQVKVHYRGFFANGEVFDSSYGRGIPIEITAGANQVILGWEEIISVLKVGEKATIKVPYPLAYGSSGKGPIPPNTDLFFDITIVSKQ